jgi:SAM-dependent methyltransferase
MTQPDHRSQQQRQLINPARHAMRWASSPAGGMAILTAGLLTWLAPCQLTASDATQKTNEDVNQTRDIHGDNLYQPSVGQDGKNVIWVPTPDALMQVMLEVVNIQSNDVLYDLGSGDGKIVITAAQRYAIEAVGIEYNPDLVSLARRNALRAGVEGKVTFIQGDIFKEDFSKASVLALYLLPELNIRLKPTILAMRPGTRVVSNTFNMGSWPADITIELDDSSRAYYWVVPAKVEGRWRLDDPASKPVGQLEIRQDFQILSGGLLLNGERLAILSGRMQGESITFTYGSQTPAGSTARGTFEGMVQAGDLTGSLREQGKQPQQLSGRQVKKGRQTLP